MMYKANESKVSKGNQSDAVREMEKAMATVIEAAKDIKNVQVDQQAAIEALRQ
jgi:hypothetical protein